MPAVPTHHTATDDGPWDGPAQAKKLRTPLTESIGNRTFAWRDAGGDGTHKSDWRFIHHFVAAAGVPGSASTLACSTGIGILNGARTGTTIPDSDRRGVYNHLVGHLKDAGVKPADLPELKSFGRSNPASVRSELGVPEQRVSRSEFELREVPNGTGGTSLRFSGFASVTGNDAAYEMQDPLGPWVESVNVGAFKRTLADGPDVAFLLNHTGMTLARTKPGTLKLSEVTDGASSPIYGVTGLHSEAMLDPQNMYVQAMRSAIERGDLDEMSFAFRVTRQEWNEDYTRRLIQQVDMDKGDVSLVNYGANPTTGGTVALRQRFLGFGPRSRRAADDVDQCNRCNGQGSIHLNDQDITCPQCKGTGTGENNISSEEAKASVYAVQARINLLRLRYPPGTLVAPRSPRARIEALRRPPWRS